MRIAIEAILVLIIVYSLFENSAGIVQKNVSIKYRAVSLALVMVMTPLFVFVVFNMHGRDFGTVTWSALSTSMTLTRPGLSGTYTVAAAMPLLCLIPHALGILAGLALRRWRPETPKQPVG